MDKSTLKGLLLMGLVILAFMFLNKPKPVQHDETAAAVQATPDPSELVLDSIRAVETTVQYAPEYIRRAGTASGDAENPVYTYSDRNVKLTLIDGKIDGTVTVNDSTTLTYAQVIASDFPETLTFDQKKNAIADLRAAVENARKYGRFASQRTAVATAADGQAVALENDVMRLEFSPAGGYINRAQLKKYFTYNHFKPGTELIDTLPVEMISADSHNTYYSLTLQTADGPVDTRDMLFTSSQPNDSTVVMSLDLGQGAQWGIRYTLPKGDSYVIGIDIIQTGMEGIIPPSNVTANLNWQMDMPRLERGSMFEERNSGVYYKYVSDSPDNLNGMKTTGEQLNQPVKWIAFKNQFFSNILIPKGQFETAAVDQTVLKDNTDYIKTMGASATVAYDPQAPVAASFSMFIGPNLYPLFSDIEDTICPDTDLKLTRLVPLGWSWLRWINTLIVIPVFNWLGQLDLSYGIIILLLTIFIKIILFPFTYKSFKSQAKMRVLAPEIKEINEKYPGKENAMVRQQKTMALYSKAGASPFSGCLPLLLQMPILIAMFSFFPSCIELRGQSFLWAHDLAAPDVICTLPFSIPWYGDKVSLFCLLMTAVNIIYTRINMQNQPSQQVGGMKWMMYLMPVMFLFFFNSYPAALSYYYLLSLLITIIQTYLFRKFTNEKKLREQMMANAAKPKKKSGFMARLEEAQRRQQEALRQQQNRRR